MNKTITLGILLLTCSLLAQNPVPTDAEIRINSMKSYANSDRFVESIPFKNIGPTVFSGRVVDIEVNPDDPTHFYVAYASGGLWETKNNGTTFDPIFDKEIVMTIGDVAVDWKNNNIWVGTGEVNSSRSSYAGIGMYKSSDNGANWTHLGLPESHHIGKVAVHPSDPNTVWVGVLGHLYSDNPERGFYMTTDGGQSWQQTLSINDKTGIVDFVVDPDNSSVLYAAAWQKERKSWDFLEAGEGSGIYKSTDGGHTWKKINKNGFPTGAGVGRIGLAIGKASGKTRIYAFLDNYDRRPVKEKDEDEGLTKSELKVMSKVDFLKLEEKDIAEYLKSNRFPDKYKAATVINQVKDDEIAVSDLAIYLEDANSLLFDTPVIGAELYSSEDGGESWNKTHDDYLDFVYNSYGYYFGVVATNPNNADEVYVAGVPILKSHDGGKTFKNINGANVHVDHHRIWVNGIKGEHIILGNDGGVNISYDYGENWIKCNSPSVGQFYYINVDNAEPYNVYGGTQDNGVWKGSHDYREGVRWHNSGQYPYKSLLGGDGMQVQIDNRDDNTVYTGFQFGNYFRIDAKSGKRKRITPKHDLGQRPYRWNWQSPILISPHNQDIVYFGANYLFRSFNRGDDFDRNSDDLTNGGRKGDVSFGTLTTIDESTLKFGLIYTGSDDGLVHVSKDGGHSWNNISSGVPKDMWISRVQASMHIEGRVFVSLNGYRWDDFSSYVYVSENYGSTWSSISDDLPVEPVNVIKEDPHHADILYVGTDRGAYTSLDGGKTFSMFSDGLTSVPVHDIVVQKRDKDLLIGTHGRSIYLADLEELYHVSENRDKALTIASINSVRYRGDTGNRRSVYSEYAKNEITIPIYSDNKRGATMEIVMGDDQVLYKSEVDLKSGLNYIKYDLSVGEKYLNDYKEELKEKSTKLKKADNGNHYLKGGSYKVIIKDKKEQSEQSFEIK